MHFYRVGHARAKDPEEVLTAISRAVPSLYPNLINEVPLFLSLNFDQQHLLFRDETKGDLIWGRVAFEVLTFSMLETFEEEFKKIRMMLNEFEQEGIKGRGFVFFASASKGVMEMFSQYPLWSFFQYQFLNSDEQEGLGLKEYSYRSEDCAKIVFSPPVDTTKANPSSPHWLKQACLARGELLELIDLSLDLKAAADSQ